MQTPNPICTECAHFTGTEWPWKCSAFPVQIPWDILETSFIHTKRHDGQTGEAVFKLKEGGEMPSILRRGATP